MSQESQSSRTHIPAPCLIDTGTIVDKRDIQRLLADLSRVRYVHIQDGQVIREGEGCILEVFADHHSATLVANHTLYLNVCSFDYLEMSSLPDGQSCFDLIQDGRQLRLMPLSNPLQTRPARPINSAALEAVVADVLSASWDAQIDDEELGEL
ncbi:hypothetical protein IQ266_06760 [filamentous cyanobacterium LEGE 11480]|uniref:Uncharacterized protein n=1 Tax=Romeriopsis navalis LEGE 11480 TaxID=2777977 RepID=A0A928Z3P8_9CYAN|nr:hypothetical protein [Romeriopsis navalis]MBE9029463.1 hypothetical protein [Romeriopsis navalis LEGE 11480]